MKKFMILLSVITGFAIGSEQQIAQENSVQEIIVENQDQQKQDQQRNESVIENQKVDVKLDNRVILAKETTFAIIKPDAVSARYTGDIISLIEKNGFEVVRMDKKTLTPEDAMSFYQAHKEKSFYNDLVVYMSSGPIVILELAKENAVADWRALIGSTDPEAAAMGTIRKMFGVSKTLNAVHGSDSQRAALEEIRIMFKS